MADAKNDPFVQGYLIAVANIVHLHDEPTIAEDVLRELQVNRRAIDPDMNEYDAKVLRELFREIERKDNLRKPAQVPA